MQCAYDFKGIVFFVVIIKVATDSNIVWVKKESPAVFGKDVHLTCSLPNDTSCCQEYSRKWSVGLKYKLTIMNGVSSNETKYSEELDEVNRMSILTIKSFSVEDLNIPYECVYGFMKYRARLMLKENEYEFHPKEMLPVKPTVSGYKIHLHVTFERIYPVPVCSAMIGVNNISSLLNVSSTSNNLLYLSTLTLKYTTSRTECTHSLNVTCLAGRTVLTVTDFILCSSKDDQFLLIIAICILGIGVSAILILAVSHTRRRNFASNRVSQPLTNLTGQRIVDEISPVSPLLPDVNGERVGHTVVVSKRIGDKEK